MTIRIAETGKSRRWSDQLRFNPTAAEKAAVCTEWINAVDNISQSDIEETFFLDRISYADGHGYPTA